MQFEDVLKDAYRDEFGRMAGMAMFPYFQKEIEIVCAPEVTPEYVQKTLGWLAEIDEKCMKEICRFASYYLQDELEHTSIGELMDEGAQHLESPLDVLKYMEFGLLKIEEPEDPNLPALNLGGGCDWREDEGIQCLIRDGQVIYLGLWNDCSVWGRHYGDDDQYLSNYVLYESREERKARTAERLKNKPLEQFCHLEIPMSSPIRKFVEMKLASMEECTRKEAWEKFEHTLLFEFMKDYPELVAENADFLYRCFCIEREKGPGDMAEYIETTCKWSFIEAKKSEG